MSIKNTLKETLIKVAYDYNIKINPKEIIINNNEEGNYLTSNIVIVISSLIKEIPEIVFKNIKENIISLSIIDNIELQKTGIINIYLKKEYLSNSINNIIKNKNKYGKNNLGNNKKININLSIKNSTKTINIKDMRKIIYSDNLSRIMDYCNYNVTKTYCIDDNILLTPESYDEYNIDNLKKESDNYRIYFDEYIIKNDICNGNTIENLLTTIRNNKYCYIDNEEILLQTSCFGDEYDRELIDENGDYTKLLIDLAYNIDKTNNYNYIIDLLSNDEKENKAMIYSSFQALEKDPNIIDIKIEGKTNITNNNLTELTNTIGLNTIRYFFSMYNYEDNINIDPHLMIEKNKDNPYHYIENTNILLSTLLKKRKKEENIIKYNEVDNNNTYNIIYKLASFEDSIIDSCLNKNPFLIAEYAYNLSTLFNDYYDKESITNNNITKEQQNILLATKIVLNNSLDLLGIIPREEI